LDNQFFWAFSRCVEKDSGHVVSAGKNDNKHTTTTTTQQQRQTLGWHNG
jgi:hypothetical protein